MAIDNISEAVQHLLEQDATLSTLVGTYTQKIGATTTAVKKIFVNTVPMEVNDDGGPFIVITDVGHDDDVHKDGRGISTAYVNVDIYHRLNKKASDMQLRVYSVLHDYSGTLDDIEIQEAWRANKGMDYDTGLEKNMLSCEYRFRLDV